MHIEHPEISPFILHSNRIEFSCLNERRRLYGMTRELQRERKIYLWCWRWTHSGHHVQMLLGAAEVLSQVVHAEVFMLAGVNPGSVLL